MSVFEKFGRRRVCTACTPQTVSGQPYALLNGYGTAAAGQTELYRELREAVPIIDTAVRKLVRLTGGFQVISKNGRDQAALDEFVRCVNVGTGTGLAAFTDIYFEQLLTYGTAVGEIVVGADGEISSLYNVPVRDVVLKRNPASFGELLVCRPDTAGGTPIKYQELAVFSMLNPDAGGIAGNSILKGLPFVSSVLLRIYSSIGQNWERAGNLRYAVTYNPGTDVLDRAYARERAEQIAREWSSAMEKDSVRDFVAVGDVQIRVIGADNQILDSFVPVRQMLEQIVAKLGIPPFMLGLSWSSTERMSSQQADALTTELTAYRRLLTPALEKICTVFLRLRGNSGGAEIVWDKITLQDAVEAAKSELYSAQAKKLSGGDANG